jgi:3-methyladenine DNA glycosylase/8-oxoguanine DNA glycosylase
MTWRPATPCPYPWIRGFLGPRAVPGLETVEPRRYRRALRVGDRAVVMTAAWSAALDTVRIDVTPALDRRRLREAASAMLDLDASLAAFWRLVDADARLRRLLADRPALRLLRFVDPAEGCIRAVLGQQISVRAAATIAGRLVRQFGEPLEGEPELRPFPRAATLGALTVEQVRALGVPGAKARAIVGLSAALDGFDWPGLTRASSEEAQKELCALPGVGPWTAAYIRMRVVGDADAFPASDLGVMKALGVSRPADAERLAERWRPWRAYATLGVWHSLSAAGGSRREARDRIATSSRVGTERAPTR